MQRRRKSWRTRPADDSRGVAAWLGPLLGALIHGACAGAPPQPPTPAPVRVFQAPPPRVLAPAVSVESPAPDPEDVAKARALVKRGELLYRTGDYDQAEMALKEAITTYPFLAQANLLLGKIFLVRGAAQRDLGLVHSARLMFEMARALDASLREAEVLLDLFVAPPLE